MRVYDIGVPKRQQTLLRNSEICSSRKSDTFHLALQKLAGHFSTLEEQMNNISSSIKLKRSNWIPVALSLWHILNIYLI